ncbi:MAG: transposase family protein, partial [Gemmatimonadetes bacterium]|nr:transposase family protein [Gemmatimonadota bacterium]MYK67702.1 transposase family protein [Gemmatimonadota bacterium]
PPMSNHEVYEEALGLTRPWFVEAVTLDRANERLLIHLDFETGATFNCGSCGAAGRKAYDTSVKEWRHLDFLGHQAFLCGPSPRVDCPTCGIRQAQLPWARRWQRLTVPFEELVVTMAREMPMVAVSRLLNEHETRLRRVVVSYEE